MVTAALARWRVSRRAPQNSSCTSPYTTAPLLEPGPFSCDHRHPTRRARAPARARSTTCYRWLVAVSEDGCRARCALPPSLGARHPGPARRAAASARLRWRRAEHTRTSHASAWASWCSSWAATSPRRATLLARSPAAEGQRGPRCAAPLTSAGMLSHLASRAAADQVLLIRRAKEPSKGEWCFPGGSLELGEHATPAACRLACLHPQHLLWVMLLQAMPRAARRPLPPAPGGSPARLSRLQQGRPSQSALCGRSWRRLGWAAGRCALLLSTAAHPRCRGEETPGAQHSTFCCR